MSILNKTGARLLAAIFACGFLIGLIVGVIGFTMAVDLMAQAAGAK
jgi:hypothetical protein